ncbi:MAG TPA: leucyl aminopeptidase [Actinomycetota bacterium]|nr:leucyl aminopeptidase [Actinomycetota bacterium]
MADAPRVEVVDRRPSQVRADVLALPFREGTKAGAGVADVSRALRADLTATLRRRGWRGRSGDVLSIPTLGRLPAETVVVVGMGGGAERSAGAVRDAAVTVARALEGARSVATTIPQEGDDAGAGAEAFVEGLLLGGYRFDRYRHDPVAPDDAAPWRVRRVTLLTPPSDRAAAREGAARGLVLAQAANWARDLVNTPSGDATPEAMAEEARAMAAGLGIRSRVWNRARIEREGFGGVLGVGRGSSREPRVVELEYGAGGAARPIALTGKGITYDSGGLALKELDELEWMKSDMAGAASVMAAFRAVAELGVEANLIAALPFADNMTGANALHPGDVITHRGGRTSEVVDPDCEGRLVVADTLAYLCERRPVAVVDAATLTDAGGLGDGLWAVLGTDRDVVDELLDAGEAGGDPGWELPLTEDYNELLRSSVADIRNSPTEGADTTGMAALYLRAFVGDVPWAHIDIGSTAWMERETSRWPKGATGSPARVFARWIAARVARDGDAPSGATA